MSTLAIDTMARTDNLQGALELLILKVLGRGANHGFAIATLIEQASDEWKVTDAARRARVYALTPRGRRRLAETEARWHDVAAAVARVLRTI
jgi:PadR family transcriptional regulator PadR